LFGKSVTFNFIMKHTKKYDMCMVKWSYILHELKLDLKVKKSCVTLINK